MVNLAELNRQSGLSLQACHIKWTARGMKSRAWAFESQCFFCCGPELLQTFLDCRAYYMSMNYFYVIFLCNIYTHFTVSCACAHYGYIWLWSIDAHSESLQLAAQYKEVVHPCAIWSITVIFKKKKKKIDSLPYQENFSVFKSEKYSFRSDVISNFLRLIRSWTKKMGKLLGVIRKMPTCQINSISSWTLRFLMIFNKIGIENIIYTLFKQFLGNNDSTNTKQYIPENWVCPKSSVLFSACLSLLSPSSVLNIRKWGNLSRWCFLILKWSIWKLYKNVSNW